MGRELIAHSQAENSQSAEAQLRLGLLLPAISWFLLVCLQSLDQLQKLSQKLMFASADQGYPPPGQYVASPSIL